jgi:ribonuclease PH
MPRPIARLSNCYVPLPVPSSSSLLASLSSSSTTSQEDGTLYRSSHSVDGEDSRAAHSLRRLCLETSVTAQLGSALVELGHTKVLCEVSLTTSDYPQGTTPHMEDGLLQCQVQYAPYVGRNMVAQRTEAVAPLESTISAGKLNSELMTRESDLSFQLSSALLPAIPLEKFPKCVLRVDTTILQDDGSVLSACITAATMALVDAKVELYDVVASCTVAVLVNDTRTTTVRKDDETISVVYLADPTHLELARAQAEICLAMSPNHKEVTLWNQSGRLTSSMANQAMELCRDGCRTMHKFMRERLIDSQQRHQQQHTQ